jgi:hypothetical protein
MRSSFWQRLVSFPAMLVSILFCLTVFCLPGCPAGRPGNARSRYLVAPAQRADSALDTPIYPPGYLFLHNLRSVVDQSRVDCRDHLLLDYLKATDLNDLFAILDHYRIGCVLTNTGSGIAYSPSAFPTMENGVPGCRNRPDGPHRSHGHPDRNALSCLKRIGKEGASRTDGAGDRDRTGDIQLGNEFPFDL